jgi:hypothetical protein
MSIFRRATDSVVANCKTGRRRILFAVFAVIFTMASSSGTAGSESTPARLANGMQLSLLRVTYGTNHTLFPGGKLDELIYQMTSGKGIQFGPLGLKTAAPLTDNQRRYYGSSPFPTKAVVWIGHHGPTNSALLPVPERDWFKEIRATLSDETGEEWETRSAGESKQTNVRGLRGVSAWSFSAFPRRGKTLHFKLYTRGASNTWDTLADFPLANPAPGPYPVWTAPTLPAVQMNGNLSVSLVELISGKKTVPYYPIARAFTKVVFEVREDDQITSRWLADRMEATDATGNEPWVPMVNYSATNNQVLYEMQVVNLSPTEVWKLKTRFVNAGDKTAARAWTSPRIEVLNGKVLPFNLKTNWRDGTLTFETSDYPFPDNLRLDLSPLPTNAVMRLVEFVDDQGRPVTYQAGGFSDSGFEALWQIPSGANWITVTMLLAETRHVEFRAQPTRQ